MQEYSFEEVQALAHKVDDLEKVLAEKQQEFDLAVAAVTVLETELAATEERGFGPATDTAATLEEVGEVACLTCMSKTT